MHRRILDGDQGLDPAVKVALHPVGRADVDLCLVVWQRLPGPEAHDARVFEKTPTMLLTRIVSDRPGTPGRRQQMPRTTMSI